MDESTQSALTPPANLAEVIQGPEIRKMEIWLPWSELKPCQITDEYLDGIKRLDAGPKPLTRQQKIGSIVLLNGAQAYGASLQDGSSVESMSRLLRYIAEIAGGCSNSC